MSKKAISFSYLFAFIIACLLLNSIENKKSTNDIYSDLSKEITLQPQVTVVSYK